MNCIILVALLAATIAIARGADKTNATVAFEQSSVQTDTAKETPAQRDARMAWWRDARFGMFVHWGLYSGLAGTWDGKTVGTNGGMEWLQKLVKVDTDTYAAAALPKFQPKPGFAREWARLAKAAGCRYLVFTTKHHEGFGLYASKFGDYNAGAKLDRDLVKEIVEACRAEGLRVGFYHSLIDWHYDQYDYTRAKGLPYPLAGKPSPNGPRDHAKYIDYLHNQVGDDGLNRPELPSDPVARKRIADQQREAVKIWEEIVGLAGEIHFPDPETADFVKVSAQYGLDLYRVYQAYIDLNLAGIAAAPPRNPSVARELRSSLERLP